MNLNIFKYLILSANCNLHNLDETTTTIHLGKGNIHKWCSIFFDDLWTFPNVISYAGMRHDSWVRQSTENNLTYKGKGGSKKAKDVLT